MTDLTNGTQLATATTPVLLTVMADWPATVVATIFSLADQGEVNMWSTSDIDWP